ncbi:MAG: hypothetical protein ACOYMN_19700, partial [Roseimicrobium sp.]
NHPQYGQALHGARKHLLPVAQALCSGFEQHGLKLFKRRGGKLWVSRTRPRALDHSAVLTDRIAKMVEVVKTSPGITVKQLVETLYPSAEASPSPAAPSSKKAPRTSAAPNPAPEEAAPPAENLVPTPEEADVPSAADAPTPAEPLDTSEDTTASAEPSAPVESTPTPAAAPQNQWSAEQLQGLKDLHWLNSEGYVIEYSDGIVFIGVNEPPPAKPKPTRPAPAPVAEKARAEKPEAANESKDAAETLAETPREDDADALPTEPEASASTEDNDEGLGDEVALEEAPELAEAEPDTDAQESPAAATEER